MLVFSALTLAAFAIPLRGITAIPTSVGTSATVCCPPNPAAPLVTGGLQLNPSPLPGGYTLLDFFTSTAATAETDNSQWGDSINEDPAELHRIYFQNLDGLRNESDEIALYVSSMAQRHVGTFCWADPGLDFSKAHVRRSLQRPISAHFTTARSAFSSCLLPETQLTGANGYQPGGTFMATTAKWATRSSGEPLVDPSGLGRWSGLCYVGKRGKRLAIITAYRSPRGQPKGGFGFYDQQYALLLSKGVAKPHVRRQFITDLVLFINKLQVDGHEVLVSLDANETIGEDRTFGLAHLIDECTLADLHSFGSSDPPATYKYGSERRIDFMLGTPAVADAVCRSGYAAYDSGGICSKHRGLYVDLDITQLMGAVDKITPSKARVLRSDDQPSVDRYLAAFTKYAEDHHLWDRVKELTILAPSLPTDICKQNFDAIDRDVT